MAHNNLNRITPFFEHARDTGRITIETMFDSNGLNGDVANHGWLWGFHFAFFDDSTFEFWAESLITTESNALGIGLGRIFNSSIVSPIVANSGAFDTFGSGFAANVKGSGSYGGSHFSMIDPNTKTDGQAGMQSVVGNTMPAWFPWHTSVDLSEPIRFHYSIFEFTDAGDTAENIKFKGTRSGANGVQGPNHDPTGAAADAVVPKSFDISALIYDTGVWRIRFDAGSTTGLIGTCGWLFPSCSIPGRTKGIQIVNTFYKSGGKIQECATDITAADDAYIDAFYAQLEDMHGSPWKHIVAVGLGGNDWTSGRTGIDFKNDFETIRTRVRARWVAAGYDLANLIFLLIGYHARTDPEFGFRTEGAELANTHSDVVYYDHAAEFNVAAMLAGDIDGTFSDNPTTGDHAHCSDNGYDKLPLRMRNVILASGTVSGGESEQFTTLATVQSGKSSTIRSSGNIRIKRTTSTGARTQSSKEVNVPTPARVVKTDPATIKKLKGLGRL